MAAIRHIEFHYHLQNNARTQSATPNSHKEDEFKKSPVWHFVDLPKKAVRPTIDIVLTSEGPAKVSDSSHHTLLMLCGLMHHLMANHFERVVVKLQGGTFGNHAERSILRRAFESNLGAATMLDGREGCVMEFDPG